MEKLDPWEAKLYEAGYAAALADAGRVLIKHAQKQMQLGENLATPILDAGLEVTRLLSLQPGTLQSGATH